MIDGLIVKDLKVFADERGRVMELLRNDEPIYKKFGQTYMSTTSPGIIKGWHYHKRQSDNIVCLHGMIKVVAYDERENSKTKGELNVFCIGEHSTKLIVMPEGVWHGWKCISTYEAIVINIVSEVYDKNNPDEVRLDPIKNHIPYNWDVKHG